MRIVWINEAADFVGGAEHYVARTARMLRERGHFCALLHRAGTGVDPVFASSFQQSSPLVALKSQLADLRADLAYLHQFHDRGLWEELAQTGVPVARFLHDHRLLCLRSYKYTAIGNHTCTKVASRRACYPCLGFVSRERGAGPGIRLRWMQTLRAEQRAHDAFAALVVGSHYMRDHVVAHGFSPAKTHRIPMPVRPPVVVPEAERRRNVLLFVGALLRGKGLDLLLEALPRLSPEVTLDVVGQGHQEHAYHEQCDRFGLRTRVRFHGRLPPSRLSELYAKTSLVVIPSREPETFGFVGPEALMHRTPVVASAVGGTSEWLRDGETALAFESGDVEGLAAAIQEMLADPERGARMAEAGDRWCRAEFSEDRHLTELLGLFSRLAAT